METIINALREILGTPNFCLEGGAWDYGAMTEYFVAAIVLCIVISSVFKFLYKLVK